METPDVTPVQIKAVVLWAVSFLSLIGIGISEAVTNQIILVATGFVTTVLPIALVLADAIIRRARANNLDKIMAAKALNPKLPESYVEGQS